MSGPFCLWVYAQGSNSSIIITQSRIAHAMSNLTIGSFRRPYSAAYLDEFFPTTA